MIIYIVIIVIGYTLLCGLTIFWLINTFNYSYTLNYYIFKFELQKPKKSFMHWFEIGMLVLLGMGFITCFISQVQIWVSKRKEKNGIK